MEFNAQVRPSLDLLPTCLAEILRKYEAGEKPEALGPDGFPVFKSDPLHDVQSKLNVYLAAASASRALPEVPPIAPTVTLRLLQAAIERSFWVWGKHLSAQENSAPPIGIHRAIAHLVENLLQQNLPFREKEILKLAHVLTGPAHNLLRHLVPLSAVLDAVDRHLANAQMTPELKLALRVLQRQWFDELHLDNDPDAFVRLCALVSDTEDLIEYAQRAASGTQTFPLVAGLVGAAERHSRSDGLTPKLQHVLAAWLARLESELLAEPLQIFRRRLRLLLGGAALNEIEPGEAWSDKAHSEIAALPSDLRQRWRDVVSHCLTARSSRPSRKWLKAAQELIECLGPIEFESRVVLWFGLVALPRPVHRESSEPRWQPNPDLLITHQNATVLKGLAWCCTGRKNPEISSALSTLAEVCFKKVRNLGPRCPRVGNACLYSLSTTSSEDAAAQLSRLDATVKQPTAKKRIGKSLDAAATLTGQTRADLEEKSVPTFGLSIDGNLTRTLGDYSAQLRIVQARDVAIRWSRKDGKTFTAVPTEVKRDYASELKQLQKLAKGIERMLAAQRIRIERLLMTEREWDFESWRQRYLEHPLLGGLAQRLIWHFKLGEQSAIGAWFGGKLVDVQSRVLEWLAPQTRVRLWHPIGASVETVRAWREWLESHEVCQPFKQAHREVYILTDAELQTGNYSNRFAAHILGQHQFAALCTQRGWKYAFMGGFDVQATPTLELSAWNMAAEFWVEPAGELAASGVALHLSTDQVRFVREGEPLPLTEVPALVFTEVMRDVDLFVGVGSIGSDPAWQDQGEIEGGGDYWRRYSFGELNVTARTRKDVLERLLPRLKIAAKCSFDEKFLVVRGQLRTYKIHLGSGNVLMEPNDQYLCIVPDTAPVARDRVFLPFEGDRTLSVILSKAFLLAEDTRINDETITRQINQGLSP